QADPEMRRHRVECAGGMAIAFARQAHELLERKRRRLPSRRRDRVAIRRQRRRVGGVAFPAAALATRTARAVLVQRDVPELTRARVAAANQLAVYEQADADAFGDRDRDEIADVLRVAAEPELREGAGVGGVLDGDRQLELLLDQRAKFDRSPAQ